jgi:chitinase
MMKKLLTTTAVILLTLQTANAEGMKCGAGKCGASMKSGKTTSAALSKMHTVDGYDIGISSQKPLIVGNNTLLVHLFKDKKAIDAKVKVKFFMPEMPGMPYMESKDKSVIKEGKGRLKVNFSMGGTWQYQLKFKTEDEKVHKVKGSINL